MRQSLPARLRHFWLALTLLPGLLSEARQRALFAEMSAFCRALPEALRGSLTEALQHLTPTLSIALEVKDLARVRQLVDLAALLDRRSPLGLCLRRSLTRYHFLRRAGLPVVVHFGAKLVGGQLDRDITGHAWLTVNGAPYYEDDENWRGFTAMFTHPASE